MTKQNLPATDGLENVMTGMGTASSKNYHSHFKLDAFNDYMQLEAAYQSNWLARQIVDIPADDMVREWRAIKCQDAEKIRIEEDRHDLQQTVNEALSWGRLYGGAAILMLTNQDLEKPLNVNQVKKGDLERLIVFDRYELMPLSINNWNPLAKNYLMPEYYTVYQGNQRIHWTHFAKFMGAKLPRRQRQVTMGWGDSELRKCISDLKLAVASYEGISELMQEANLDVITREGLADDLTTDQESAITDRYTLYSMMKSLFKLSLLDGDEKLDRMTLNLSGVAPVMETQMSWMCGASRIPQTKLFGKSPSGLNSSGDGELKTYYDDVRSWQVSQLDPPVNVLDQVLVRSALGNMPTDYNWEWNRLYQPNRKEEADASKIEAETDIMLLDAGVIQKSQVQRRLQSAEAYQFNDGQIEELEGLEDANLFDRDEPEPTADE
ncbi:MAG TPA: DUF1073 domain-containing protein [Methylophaga aminisulfidivorans]|uniref:DUF1073 domain-containing protein n=2 Tax=root TaxID=1 RepID=A0A7C1VYF4_9GAMM|nr:DUF1073 domain-containing protein [Methylophaga aminisulfidivorans]